MAVAEAVGVFKRRFHQRAVVMDAVIDGQCRHHPLASGMPVGRGRVCVIQFEASADGVGNGLQHVGTADGGTPYGKFALAVRGHDVKIAVTVNILQRIICAVDTVAQRNTGICRYFQNRTNGRKRNGDRHCKCDISTFGCRSRLAQCVRSLPYKRSVESYAGIQSDHDAIAGFPNLVG